MTSKTAKPSCDICCETYNKSTREKVKCPIGECTFSACKTCTRSYLLSTTKVPCCMSCNGAWNEDFLKENLNKVFIDKEYYQHRMKIALDRQIALLPETMDDVENYKIAREMKKMVDQTYKEHKVLLKKLNFIQRNTRSIDKLKPEYQLEINKLNEDIATCVEIMHEYENAYRQRITTYRQNGGAFNPSESKVNRKFMLPCPSDNCKGFIDESYRCPLCNILICCECQEKVLENENHKCSKEAIETVKSLQKDTKACPTCAARIFKIEGCDQMYCTQCHTAFSWNTGMIETGRIHNPHYYEYRRQQGNLQREQGDIPCGGIRELIGGDKITQVCYVATCTTNYGLNTFYQNELEKYYTLQKQLNDIDNIMCYIHRYYGDIEWQINRARAYITTDSQYNLKHYRVQYILNEISKEMLGKKTYLQERSNMCNTEIIHINELLMNFFQDLYNDYYDDILRLKNCLIKQLGNIYNIDIERYRARLFVDNNSFNDIYTIFKRNLEKKDYRNKRRAEVPLFDEIILKDYIEKYNNKFVELEKLLEYVNLHLCRISATYEVNTYLYFLRLNILNGERKVSNIFRMREQIGIRLWKEIKKSPSTNSIMGIPKTIWTKFENYPLNHLGYPIE